MKQYEHSSDFINELIRTHDKFYFLMKHMCEVFIEINIKTGECVVMHSSNGMEKKNTFAEQIAWLSDNFLAENERVSFLSDFDLKNLIGALEKNSCFYKVTYTFKYQGKKHNINIVSALIKDSTIPNSQYIISFFQDVTAIIHQKEENQKLLEINRHDDLTTLYNRSFAEKFIVEHLANNKDSAPGTLAIIDIDSFKSVNDIYGHSTGDLILKQFSLAILEIFRSEDMLCRWGGDEFMVFIKGVDDPAVIAARFERLRIKIAAIKIKGHLVPITVSIGAAIAKKGSSMSSLFTSADLALYKVKDSGRDGYLILVD